jgi:hypothetical protein
MLKLLFTLFLGVFATAFSAFGQGDWTSLFNNQNVSIEYRYDDCHRPEDGIHKQNVHLKFTNLTGSTQLVSYQKKVSYNNKPAAATSAENTFTITLKPGEVMEGSCSLKDNRLAIFVKMLDGTSQSVMSSFELVNVKVTQP